MGQRIAVGNLNLIKQAGVTYLGLLIFVAASSFALAATFQVWHTVVQREKEAELLFIGNEFRQALIGYFEARPANVIGQAVRRGQRPMKLEDLLEDNRFITPQHWLRKIYVDPMTGKSEWGLVILPDGQITGVHSLSEVEPLKKAGFLVRDADFAGKNSYAEWIFSPNIKLVAGVPPGGPDLSGGIGPGRVIPRIPPGAKFR